MHRGAHLAVHRCEQAPSASSRPYLGCISAIPPQAATAARRCGAAPRTEPRNRRCGRLNKAPAVTQEKASCFRSRACGTFWHGANRNQADAVGALAGPHINVSQALWLQQPSCRHERQKCGRRYGVQRSQPVCPRATTTAIVTAAAVAAVAQPTATRNAWERDAKVRG